MGILKQFFNNTRKPNGWMGKLMVNGMNQGMPLFPIGAFPIFQMYRGQLILCWRISDVVEDAIPQNF